jgi:DNA-binding PucR family transcriptional regulator
MDRPDDHRREAAVTPLRQVLEPYDRAGIVAAAQPSHTRATHLDADGAAVAGLVADVAAAVSRHAAAVSEDVYQEILREIAQLNDDKPLRALLASSVDSNLDACLQIMQHRIDLAAVQAPAVAVEYARRLAQRGTPLTALLRAYRLGHARFSDWLLTELARQAGDAEMITAATLGMSKIVAGYIDQTSEEMVAAYTQARENWLRNGSAARAAGIRDLLSGERIDLSAAEAALGYRLRQYHVGLVCWTGDAAGRTDEITRLEHAIGQVAEHAACSGSPVFLPRDESSAWAWLPLGIRDTFASTAEITADLDGDIHFAFGDAAKNAAGFCVTHQEALAAQAVALAKGSPVPRTVAFGEVAPVALMLGASGLLRAWVLSTLADLAIDDEYHARLRETLLVFLQTGGSYKTTAEQLMLHKNTVQYRIRKAEESLGRPVGGDRHNVELALQAGHWLGSSVLRRATAPGRQTPPP